MTDRQALAAYLQDFLSCDQFRDYAPNGLQVEGRDRVQRLCTAVTASQEVIQQAIAHQADALLVHHGYFWKGEPPELVGMKRARLAALLKHDVNLFAYHLPLDCHPELGNNACFGQVLGAESVRTHSVGGVQRLLWSGDLDQPLSAKALTALLQQALQRAPQVISPHHRPIQRIAWCTGGAQDYLVDAAALGVDAFCSGEISERTYYQAMELGLHYFACGHHATERGGIQALGQHLAEVFELEHWFLDSDNPV